MKLCDIYDRIDAAVPKRLSDEYIAAYGGHDNSGVLIDCGKEIAGAVFSLDFSLGALETARRSGKNLLVTHHPAIFYPVSSLQVSDPLGRRLLLAAESGISVISMHLNVDCAVGGTDEQLARAIGGSGKLPPEERIEGGGYGRIFAVPKQPFGALCAHMREELNTRRMFVYGREEENVEKVASFCGAGADGQAIARARRAGAQVLVSADIKHNVICDALESGLKVVQLTHYASENYGFKILYKKLSGELGVPCEYHEDAELL